VDVVLPSMLHAQLFRSSVPHAKIRRVDVNQVRALTRIRARRFPQQRLQVKAVVTQGLLIWHLNWQ
jgi:hypothetical protein